MYDDYSGRTQAAGRQTMTMRQHLNPRDLKLQGHGTMTPGTDQGVGQRPMAQRMQRSKKPNRPCQTKRFCNGSTNATQKTTSDASRVLMMASAKLLDYLDTAGLADNTIVIYSSDQGWYLGEHGWFDKRWMYEESLKTPLADPLAWTCEAGHQ